MQIHFVLLISRQGKVRLTKWCSPYSQNERSRVCELDLIFNFSEACYLLDEILIAGELQESSKRSVIRLMCAHDSVVEMAKEHASPIGKVIAQVTKKAPTFHSIKYQCLACGLTTCFSVNSFTELLNTAQFYYALPP